MYRKRREKEYLADMVEAMQRIIDYTLELTYEEFLADRKTQDAVLRNLQVMGSWKEIAEMRDKVVHDYFGISFDAITGKGLREEAGMVESQSRFLATGLNPG